MCSSGPAGPGSSSVVPMRNHSYNPHSVVVCLSMCSWPENETTLCVKIKTNLVHA